MLVQGQLGAINEKLDALQDTVTAMRADLRRLTGKPVLEEFAELREQERAKGGRLPSAVYIPHNGIAEGPDDDKAFVAHPETNKPYLLMERCKRFFREQEDQNREKVDQYEPVDQHDHALPRDGSERAPELKHASCWNSAVAWNPEAGDEIWVRSKAASESAAAEPKSSDSDPDSDAADSSEPELEYQRAKIDAVNSDGTFDVSVAGLDPLVDTLKAVSRKRIRESPPRSMLLVHGVAGSGKSVVSQHLLRYLSAKPGESKAV